MKNIVGLLASLFLAPEDSIFSPKNTKFSIIAAVKGLVEPYNAGSWMHRKERHVLYGFNTHEILSLEGLAKVSEAATSEKQTSVLGSVLGSVPFFS